MGTRKGDQGQGRRSSLQVKLGWWCRWGWKGWGTEMFLSVMGSLGVRRLLLAKLTAKVVVDSQAKLEKEKQD